MQIELNAAEIARLARLVHLANDAQDAALWSKLKAAHVANCERDAFNASDAWDHEYCDPNICNGTPHTDAVGAPVIQPNPIQTCADGLDRAQSAAAYQQIMDALHADALAEHRARTAVANGTARRAPAELEAAVVQPNPIQT